MPEQLLNVLKLCLLALLYLFFVRVARAVWVEVNGPRLGSARPRHPDELAAPGPAGVQPPPGAALPSAGIGGVGTGRGAPALAPAAPPPVALSAAPRATIRSPVGGSRRQAKRAAAPAAASPVPGPALVVLAPPELLGRRYQLAQELTLGRAAGCQITLDDTYVSQLHARIFRAEDVLYVEDLGSTNGTYLNRNKVSGPLLLEVGDQVQVGSTIFELVA